MRRVPAATAIYTALVLSACNGDPVSGPTMEEGDRVAVLSALGNPDLWVGPGGDDTNPGTRESPFRTIQGAIDAAPEGSTTRIKVMGGLYFENLTLRSNVSIQGGLRKNTGEWYRSRLRKDTTIVGAPGQPAVLGMGVTNVRLKDLVIRSGDATLGSNTQPAGSYTGSSSIAIHLQDSRKVTISSSDIRAGDGLDGGGGQAGTKGADGLNGGEGAPGGPADWVVMTALLAATEESDLIELWGWLKTGDGGYGAEKHLGLGTVGDGGDGGCGIDLSFAARPGEAGHTGGGFFSPLAVGGNGGVGLGSSGSSGQEGLDGPLSGSDGPAGGGFGTILEGRYLPPAGGPGTPGDHGNNGGGGGGGAAPAPLTCGSGGGGGGSGGKGGEGGAGGEGGGASIAVLLTQNSEVLLERNRLRTGNGGDGGAGGAGGRGGDHGLGGRGGITNRSDPEHTTCIAPFGDWVPEVGCGAAGGDGGDGAPGGQGGRGGGGPSVGIARDATSTATLQENSFDLGEPGNGGDGTPGGSATQIPL